MLRPSYLDCCQTQVHGQRLKCQRFGASPMSTSDELESLPRGSQLLNFPWITITLIVVGLAGYGSFVLVHRIDTVAMILRGVICMSVAVGGGMFIRRIKHKRESTE